jgi:solute carrier family 35 protein E1
VTYYFFTNGTVNFLQNIIAFVILSSTSPVTYSIASLIKRVVVICIAIMWFNQAIHPVQAFGIGMTFLGLWMYNNAKGDVEKGEKKMRMVEAQRELMLPSTRADGKMMSGVETPPNEIEEQERIAISTGTGKGSKMGTIGRPRGMTLTHLHPSPKLQHHIPVPSIPQSATHTPLHGHGHPNLHIKITPPIPTKTPPISRHVHSPMDSYPSPPPSLDSPPLSSTMTIPARIPVSSQINS